MAMLCLLNGQLMKYSLVKTAHGRGKHGTVEKPCLWRRRLTCFARTAQGRNHVMTSKWPRPSSSYLLASRIGREGQHVPGKSFSELLCCPSSLVKLLMWGGFRGKLTNLDMVEIKNCLRHCWSQTQNYRVSEFQKLICWQKSSPVYDGYDG